MPITDYLVLTALDREWDAAQPILVPKPKRVSRTGKPTYYTWTVLFPQDRQAPGEYLVAAAPMSMWTPGQANAAIFVTASLADWDPNAVVLLGIAGSMEPARIFLGDVVVSSTVYGYEVGTADSNGFRFRQTVHQAGALDLDRVRDFKRDPDRYKAWEEECRDAAHDFGLGPLQRLPELHIEVTASGNMVVRSAEFGEQLKAQINEYIAAVEMEAVGLYHALYQNGGRQNALMIRGISDYADENMAAVSRQWQLYASANAARFLCHFWQGGPVPPLSPTYQLKLAKGEPHLFRQQITSGGITGPIRDIRYKGVGTQQVALPLLLERTGVANPPLVLTVTATLRNGQPATGFRGLCLFRSSEVRQIDGTSPMGNKLYISLPSTHSGFRADLLLSFPDPCREITVQCEDDFGREVTEVLTLSVPS